MFSSPRVGTPYAAMSSDANDAYFELGSTSSSPLLSSIKGGPNARQSKRPATPGCYSPSLGDRSKTLVAFGENTYVPCPPSFDRAAKFAGLGIGGFPSTFTGGASARATSGGTQSRTPSGNLSSRRPSLRISDMPDSSLSAEVDGGDGSSSSGSSEGTLTLLSSVGISSNTGIMHRSAIGDEEDSTENIYEGEAIEDESETPTVPTFALAMANSKRRATPYPSSKVMYFQDSDVEEEDDEDSGASDSEETRRMMGKVA